MLKNLLTKFKSYLMLPVRDQHADGQHEACVDSHLANPGKGRKPLIGRIDRYIIGKFITTYIFLIAIIIVIAVVFDINENIDSHKAMPRPYA